MDAGPTFCQRAVPVPIFCADFDTGNVRAGFINEKNFPDLFVSAGGKLEPDDDVGRGFDGTRGVRVSLPPAGPGRRSAWLAW